MNEQSAPRVRAATAPASRRPTGPHPGILATVSAILLLASLVLTAVLSGGRSS